jgi:tRNA threonylcarbamoyladenosine biosynthesis protein TsaE
LNLDLETGSEEETVRLGKRLGSRLKGGEVITLSGPLGAGKTSFAKGVGEALRIPSKEMPSPTFILRAEHEGRLPLAHIDLYRIDSPAEVERLGLFEQEEPLTILLIEWPENARSILPPERVEITISPVGETQRRITIAGIGNPFTDLLNDLKKR